MKQPKIYLPGLNGLRAIAALIVLSHHMLEGTARVNIKPLPIFKVFFGDAASHNGTNIFFTISGFLITYLLLNEKQASHSINLRRFYWNRTLRIWPLYFLYLFVIIGLTLILHNNFNYTILAYFFFAGNIVRSVFPEYSYFLITHFWSLGVEQQFYMVWPVALNKIKKNLVPMFLTFALLAFSAKLFTFSNSTLYYICRFIIESRFQFLIFGGVGAVLYFNRSKYIEICYDKGVQLCSLSMILIMMTNIKTISFFSAEIVSVGVLIMIIALVSNKSYFLKLENRALNFLGKISYGIYVIHPLVLWGFARVCKYEILPGKYVPLAYCLAIPGITVVLAYISYQYFEKRFLNMKNRYSVTPILRSIEPEPEIKLPQITLLEKDIHFKTIILSGRLRNDDTRTDLN